MVGARGSLVLDSCFLGETRGHRGRQLFTRLLFSFSKYSKVAEALGVKKIYKASPTHLLYQMPFRGVKGRVWPSQVPNTLIKDCVVSSPNPPTKDGRSAPGMVTLWAT